MPSASAAGRGRSCGSRSSRLLLCLVLPESIAPRVNGSRRFLFGSSFQPSEFGKLAVVVWTSMLIVKKGDQLAPPDEGRAPVLRRHRRARRARGARAGPLGGDAVHVDARRAVVRRRRPHRALRPPSFALAIPVLWHKIEKGAIARAAPRPAFLDPGGAPAQVNYQLKQSLIAVGSGGLFGVGFGGGATAVRLPPIPVQRLHRPATSARSGASSASLAITIAFAAYGPARLPHRASGAFAISAARGGGTHLRHRSSRRISTSAS